MFKRIWNNQSGQSAVELALTLPLLLLLICGMLEMGWVSANKLTLQNITREGVRAGIVATSAANNSELVTTRICEMKPAYMKNQLSVTVSYTNISDFRAGDIKVVTLYRLPAITPLAGLFTRDGAFGLRAECTMKMS
ncbi:MAG: TadE/TadG family type IV pilus assembly protein [Clostridia bacterium]